MATAGSLIANARQRAGLTQSELARRAGMPRSVVNAYERGKREPGAAALDQLLEAAGMRLELAPRRRPRRGRRFGARLLDVLGLADALPQRHAPQLAYPPLAERAPVTTLVEKILRLDDRLAAEHVPHAFGGALALAYYTEDPRGTDDIDLNVFVEVERAGAVFASLPDEVAWKQSHVDAVRRHGQVRVFWDHTPLDLFFENHPFHAGTARRAQSADLAGHAIPVLDAVDLAVFKAMFDRTRDWADIEAMLEADALDTAAVLGHLTEMLGHDDPITQRFARLAQVGSAP